MSSGSLMAAQMNNSFIIQLPVLQKAVNNDAKVMSMPALQFSLLVNKPPKNASSPPLPQQHNENEPQVSNPVTENFSKHQIQNAELPPLEMPTFPPWLSSMDPPLFRCEECGDSFLYEANLKKHQRRRSVHIKFPCVACKSSLTYFNRCALLAHIKRHTDLPDQDLEKTSVVPLDRDSLFLDVEVPPVEMLNGVESENSEETGKTKSDQFNCSECFQLLRSARAREEHFSPRRYGSHECGKCPTACPSKCSLEAHQRIHLQIKPFVCPECGRSENDWNAFEKHLDRVCFHNSRTVGYKCMLCNELEVSASVQPHKHMLATHSEAYYKCQACPMAFKGPTSFESHKKLAHPTLSEVPCKTIFKCPLCDTVFHGREQLIAHLNIHMKDEKIQMQPVFVCPQCYERFKTSSLLRSHFRECHPNEAVPETEEEQAEEEKSAFLPPKVEPDGSVHCNMCPRIFNSIRSYNIHSGRQHCRRRFLCVLCNLTLPDLKTLFAHEQDHLVKGELLCMLCHAQKSSKEELSCHLQRHMNRFKFPYWCPFCEETLKNYGSAVKHVEYEHHLSPKPDETNTKLTTRNRSAIKPEEKSTSNLPPIKIKIPLTLVRQRSEDAGEFSADSRSESPTNVRTYAIPTKKLRLHDGPDTSYICAKCDFLSADQKEFHKHIQFHRKHASSLQCPDCGTCFVVETTLRKHLKVAHHVPDIDAYLHRSGISRNGPKKDEVQKSNPRQCTICYQNFESDSFLKSHLRSHGMAFIRSRPSFS